MKITTEESNIYKIKLSYFILDWSLERPRLLLIDLTESLYPYLLKKRIFKLKRGISIAVANRRKRKKYIIKNVK